MDKLFGLYDVERRQYYADDGGGSSRTETLVVITSDVESLKAEMNALWSHPSTFAGKPRRQLSFTGDSLTTNGWSNDGGGCMADGYFELRELTEECGGYVDRLKNRIAAADEETAKREQEAVAARQQAALNAEKEAARVKAAKVRDVTNARRRQRRIDDNEAVNKKQREGRQRRRRELNEIAAAAKRRTEAFREQLQQMSAVGEVSDDAYYALYYTHYPERKPK